MGFFRQFVIVLWEIGDTMPIKNNTMDSGLYHFSLLLRKKWAKVFTLLWR